MQAWRQIRGRSGCHPGADREWFPHRDPWVLAVVATLDHVRVTMTVRFSSHLVPELIQPFWAAWQAGEFLADAAAKAGTHRHRGLAGWCGRRVFAFIPWW